MLKFIGWCFLIYVIAACLQSPPLEERKDYKSGYEAGHEDGLEDGQHDTCWRIKNLNSSMSTALEYQGICP